MGSSLAHHTNWVFLGTSGTFLENFIKIQQSFFTLILLKARQMLAVTQFFAIVIIN